MSAKDPVSELFDSLSHSDIPQDLIVRAKNKLVRNRPYITDFDFEIIDGDGEVIGHSERRLHLLR